MESSQKAQGTVAELLSIAVATVVILLPTPSESRGIRAPKEVKQYCESMIGTKYSLRVAVAALVGSRGLYPITAVENGRVYYEPKAEGIAQEAGPATSVSELADIVKTRRLDPSTAKRAFVTFVAGDRTRGRGTLWQDLSLLVIAQSEVVTITNISLPNEGEDVRDHLPDLQIEIEGQFSEVLDVGLDRVGVSRTAFVCRGDTTSNEYTIQSLENCMDAVFLRGAQLYGSDPDGGSPVGRP